MKIEEPGKVEVDTIADRVLPDELGRPLLPLEEPDETLVGAKVTECLDELGRSILLVEEPDKVEAGTATAEELTDGFACPEMVLEVLGPDEVGFDTWKSIELLEELEGPADLLEEPDDESFDE